MSSCFYDKGLKFSCKNCRCCCSEEPGFVFLSQSDLENMAAGLNMTVQNFFDTYCRLVDMGAFKMVSLLEDENYDCIFLSENGCKIYEYRPIQCRTYPFWANVLESKQTWEEESKRCPGINSGKLFSKKEIEERLEYRLNNEPIVIFK